MVRNTELGRQNSLECLSHGLVSGRRWADDRPAAILPQDKPGVADPLPSWNDGPSKKAVIEFVMKVTKESSPDFVPGEERVATFDNDGTLWVRRPVKQ
jgi:hypothetical protein